MLILLFRNQFVKVYDLSGDGWVQLGQDISDNPNDGFGSSLSFNEYGTRLAIGARSANLPGPTVMGNVKIYDLSGDGWVEMETDLGDNFTLGQFGGKHQSEPPMVRALPRGGRARKK